VSDIDAGRELNSRRSVFYVSGVFYV
jgi:hypothetical protein